jgi:hypothetical protein
VHAAQERRLLSFRRTLVSKFSGFLEKFRQFLNFANLKGSKGMNHFYFAILANGSGNPLYENGPIAKIAFISKEKDSLNATFQFLTSID